MLCPTFVPIRQLLMPLCAFRVSGVALAHVPVEAPMISHSSWTTIAVEIIAVDALGRDLAKAARSLADGLVLVVIFDELVVLSEPKGHCWKSFFTREWTYKLSSLE